MGESSKTLLVIGFLIVATLVVGFIIIVSMLFPKTNPTIAPRQPSITSSPTTPYVNPFKPTDAPTPTIASANPFISPGAYQNPFTTKENATDGYNNPFAELGKP